MPVGRPPTPLSTGNAPVHITSATTGCICTRAPTNVVSVKRHVKSGSFHVAELTVTVSGLPPHFAPPVRLVLLVIRSELLLEVKLVRLREVVADEQR